MATFPPTFTTDRLHLRRLNIEDAQGVFAYSSDPQVAEYMTFPLAVVETDALEFLEGIQPLMDSDKEFHWGIRLHTTKQLMGVISLTRSEHGLECGYVLHRSYWGNGYIPEALRALLRWAFEIDNTFRFWATCHEANSRSARVLINVGMTEEGTLRNWLRHPNLAEPIGDCRVFSILPAEFSDSKV